MPGAAAKTTSALGLCPTSPELRAESHRPAILVRVCGRRKGGGACACACVCMCVCDRCQDNLFLLLDALMFATKFSLLVNFGYESTMCTW